MGSCNSFFIVNSNRCRPFYYLVTHCFQQVSVMLVCFPVPVTGCFICAGKATLVIDIGVLAPLRNIFALGCYNNCFPLFRNRL